MTTILTSHFGVSLQSGGIPQIKGLLEKIEAEAAAREYAEAEEYRLQAYAIFETAVESRLVGRDGALASQLEALFWEGTTWSSHPDRTQSACYGDRGRC